MLWKYILISILIVILIFIIIYLSKNTKILTSSYWTESPAQIYTRSDGTFDAAARLALDRVRHQPRPTASDHYVAGSIISHNILGQESMPTMALNEETRRRLDLHAQVANHYNNAISKIETENSYTIEQDIVEVPQPPPPEEINPMIMMYEMIIHAGEGLRQTINNAPFMIGFLTADELEILQIMDTELQHAAEDARDNLINRRQAVSRTNAPTRASAAETYFSMASAATNDLQNSHDSSVSACLSAIVDRLRSEQGNEPLPSIHTITAELQSYGPAWKIRDAMQVIEKTKEGNRIVSLNLTDDECLRRIWARTSHPKNASSKENMRQAVFDALADCWEVGLGGRHIVCINGRISRLLSSLVLLDFDERNWEIRRLEEFKSDIFNLTKNVLTETAKNVASNSVDVEKQKAAKSYLASTTAELESIGEISDQAMASLNKDMEKNVITKIDEYILSLNHKMGATEVIPARLIESVKKEAVAAIYV